MKSILFVVLFWILNLVDILGLFILYVDTLVIANYSTLKYIFVKFCVTSIVKRLCIGSNNFIIIFK